MENEPKKLRQTKIQRGSKRLVIKNTQVNSPRELELQKLRLKYSNDTQTDPRLHGEKPWIAYFVSLIENAVNCSGELPDIEKLSPSSWSFNITNADRELYPIELANARTVVIFFDEFLEVFYAELFI